MSGLVDISVGLHEGMPVWPGSPGFRYIESRAIAAGDPVNNGRIDTDLHVGTHIDAPAHFLSGAATVEQLDLDPCIGPARVVEFADTAVVTADHLEDHVGNEVDRLLLKTDNSGWWPDRIDAFRDDYVALSVDAARWIAAHSIRLVGIDYLSIQPFGGDRATHDVLLQAGVVIVEGLNLSVVEPGDYDLVCLPLKIVGADGAPARAVLRAQP